MIMQRSTLILGCLLFIMGVSRLTASSDDCKIPSFDTSRCYQVYTDLLSWGDAAAACRGSGQRLATLENGNLLKFVIDNFYPELNLLGFRIQLLRIFWIGLSPTSDGQQYTWTSGQRLDRSLYTNILFSSTLTSSVYGNLCGAFYWPLGIFATNCSYPSYRICETVRSLSFHARSVGYVVSDVSSGQQVASDVVVSVIDCVRRCKGDETCLAISHDGVTCQLHVQQAGHNITVTRNVVVYTRIN
ncbi:uncharacterized protein LOC112562787 [Pomacea canaliculata]|uniref:uncharacterized protein LOC112562787 n=1 Tax=Pomacea canaliculata TaxID=400727 RepID=UPI000D7358B8|nr:uncharacterized protein LOC112562787 [Pomacea canaliculata]